MFQQKLWRTSCNAIIIGATEKSIIEPVAVSISFFCRRERLIIWLCIDYRWLNAET